MLKFKKVIATVISIGMGLSSIPITSLSAFAEETKIYTYDDYSIEYKVTNSWGNTDAVDVEITNTGDETIENWMLSYDDFCGNIDAPWNATVVEVENDQSYIRNVGYNANIQPNESISFGYQLEDAGSIPQEITLCQERVAKSSDDYSTSLNITGEWGSIFNAEIVLHNNMEKPLEWWELTFDSNFTITEITSSWAADKIDLGNDNYIFKGTYTGIVPPQSTVLLGFSGVKNENLDNPVITVQGLTEVVFGGFPNEIDEEVARQEELEYIESLNENSEYPLELAYNDDGTAYSIDGKFSEVLVTDSDSAVTSLESVRHLLGIENPNTQLSIESVYSNKANDYTVYNFYEVYKNIKVYDRFVSVVARNNGEVISLNSNFRQITNNMSVVPLIPENTIISEFNTSSYELEIYNYDEYEEAPLLVYIIDDGDYLRIISTEDTTIVSSIDKETKDINLNDEQEDYDIYHMSNENPVTDSDGNIIYIKGNFGEIHNIESTMPEIVFSNIEKEQLKINDSNISFQFAAKGETYISQTVSNDDYNTYATNHKTVLIKSNDNSKLLNVAVNEYHFDQIYCGYKVYGRILTETVNDNGESIILDSNILSKSELQQAMSNIHVKNDLSLDSVRKANSRLNSYEPEMNDPVLYTWDEYSDDPVLIYLFLDKENNRTYFVSAESDDYGQIINENVSKYQLGKGLDEGNGNESRCLRYFPILENGTMGFSKSFDDGHNGTMAVYSPEREITYDTVVSESPVISASTFFYEPEAVSAYLNTIKAYDFYVNNFNHYFDQNNCNKKDNILKIYFKSNSKPGALASTGFGYMKFPVRDLQIKSNASSRPWTVAHEYTHAIFHAFNSGVPIQGTVSRGLNEAYAYLLGYNLFTDWAEVRSDFQFKPNFKVNFNSSSLDYLVNEGYTTVDGHSMSCFAYYPAILMKESGFTNFDIGNLFYQSMIIGKYNRKSTLNSFRVNIIKSAKMLHYDYQHLEVVRNALDKIWSQDNRVYDFTLNVNEYLNPNADIQNLTVSLKKTLNDKPLVSHDENSFVYTVEPGVTYYLEVSAPGYVTYRNKVHMYYMENNTHTVELVKLNYDSNNEIINGNALIHSVDCITNESVGAIVQLRMMDESFNMVFITDDKGTPISYYADDTTGYTNAISVSPGYYFPYVSEADNHFVKPMMTVGSDSSIPSEDSAYIYYDSNLDGSKQSHFHHILINEYYEDGYSINTDFNAFDTLTVLTEQDAYVGRSGPTQFGRELYLLYYKPTCTASFNLVFKPNQSQLKNLEDILRAEGNLCTDPTTGELTLGHLKDGKVVAQPSSLSYYNIEISNNTFGITSPTIISAWDLYYGLTHNNGIYTLKLISYDENGNLES